MAESNDLSRRLAEHVVGVRFEDLSPKAVQMARYALLDAIGVSLGASGLGEGCDAFVSQAMAQGATEEATILGYGKRTSAALAAFANGALAHALDFEDAFDGAPVHPNAQTVPAVLALAESLPSVSGRDVIAALAVGCDLVCRLGQSPTPSIDSYGWYPPPIFGAFGATAAAARLLRLSVEQTLDAFSLTLCQATCSAEIKYNPDSVIRAVRDAFAAQAGIVSAQLAARGVRGFNQPFEGKAGFFALFARGQYSRQPLLTDLGRGFLIEELSFKPWPACRGTHAFIDAALQLRAQHSFGWQEVASGQMTGSTVQLMLYEPQAGKRRPSTAIDAKFSLPFTVASALIHGGVTLASYETSALHEPAVLALAEKLSYVVSDEPLLRDSPTSGRLSLTLRGGKTVECTVVAPLGAIARPLAESTLIDKFKHCASQARVKVPQQNLGRIISGILSLEQIESPRDEVLRYLR